MPKFNSAGDFAAELSKLEKDMERRYRSWGTDIAQEAEKVSYEAASADLGGDRRFSGWRPQLDLQVRPKRFGAALIPTRSSAGPWTVAEYGRNTTAGFGRVRRTRDGGVRLLKSGRVSMRKAKRWNGVTAGKGTATRARRKFDQLAERTANRRYRVTLRRHFD